jgi:3-oxoacyl-[acyl-carrier protein] reductase
MGQLDGRVAIITGAAGGIGKATARRYAEEGARLVLADVSADALIAVRDDVASLGVEVQAVAGDVALESHIDEVIAAATESFGRIDILANIAQGGLDEHTFLDATTVEIAEKAYRTGPVQSLLFMQKAFPLMKEQHYGRIINTASASAIFGLPGFTAYEMAKGAVMALTRTASQEWAQYGIVTNTFLPVVHTPAYDLTEQGRAAAVSNAERNPTRRFGTPYEDCTPVLLFLASEGAGYINGQAIGVDGGQFLLA